MPPSQPLQTRRRTTRGGLGFTGPNAPSSSGPLHTNPFFNQFPSPLIGTTPRPIFNAAGVQVGSRRSEREELLLGIGQGTLAQGDQSGKGFANSLGTFFRAGINIPFGAGPALTASPAGNPLASFGNTGPIITGGGALSSAARSNPSGTLAPQQPPPIPQAPQPTVPIGGPATSSALARLGAPPPITRTPS